MTPSARLAQFARTLPGFDFYTSIDGNYNHIGATVADAVLQANNKYATNVKPRINRILAVYPDASTTSAVRCLLQSIPVTEFLHWRGEDRAERFSHILALFKEEGIESQTDLQAWLSRDSNLPKLRAIRGIGPKTVDYFKILVGISTSAIDRHLIDFLKQADISCSSYDEAQDIINTTADILAVDRAHFDHSIWQYMSQRKAALKPRHGACDKMGAVPDHLTEQGKKFFV